MALVSHALQQKEGLNFGFETEAWLEQTGALALEKLGSPKKGVLGPTSVESKTIQRNLKQIG